jgi:Rod binding domain-containing protein
MRVGTVPAERPRPNSARDASQEFESLFIAKLFEAMRKTAPEGGVLAASGGEQMFRSMMDDEISRQIAHAGGLGLGDMLYQQLSRDTAAERGGERNDANR